MHYAAAVLLMGDQYTEWTLVKFTDLPTAWPLQKDDTQACMKSLCYDFSYHCEDHCILLERMMPYRTSPAFQLLQSLWPELLSNLFGTLILLCCVKKTNGWLLLKCNFLVVVNTTASRALLAQLYAGCLQLSLLLQAC